ncbi:hypothetical protein GGI24_006212 [Coemansia furcata]|nr:hypothetical protein GGI24_006212 [Coemansia furcata]
MVIANYPGYPTIPEFNGNYETGMEYYTGAKNITVSPSGGSGGSQPPSPPASPNPPYATPSAPVASPTLAYSTLPMPASYSAPVSSAPPVASPTYAAGNGNIPHNANPGNSGSCSPGAMQCSGTGYNYCVGGAWSQSYSCGTGTVCQSAGNGIYCGYP